MLHLDTPCFRSLRGVLSAKSKKKTRVQRPNKLKTHALQNEQALAISQTNTRNRSRTPIAHCLSLFSSSSSSTVCLIKTNKHLVAMFSLSIVTSGMHIGALFRIRRRSLSFSLSHFTSVALSILLVLFIGWSREKTEDCQGEQRPIERQLGRDLRGRRPRRRSADKLRFEIKR